MGAVASAGRWAGAQPGQPCYAHAHPLGDWRRISEGQAGPDLLRPFGWSNTQQVQSFHL